GDVARCPRSDTPPHAVSPLSFGVHPDRGIHGTLSGVRGLGGAGECLPRLRHEGASRPRRPREGDGLCRRLFVYDLSLSLYRLRLAGNSHVARAAALLQGRGTTVGHVGGPHPLLVTLNHGRGVAGEVGREAVPALARALVPQRANGGGKGAGPGRG